MREADSGPNRRATHIGEDAGANAGLNGCRIATVSAASRLTAGIRCIRCVQGGEGDSGLWTSRGWNVIGSRRGAH
jgi:hypothetical protein